MHHFNNVQELIEILKRLPPTAKVTVYSAEEEVMADEVVYIEKTSFSEPYVCIQTS